MDRGSWKATGSPNGGNRLQVLEDFSLLYTNFDFLGGSDGKVSADIVGDPGSIPGLGSSPGEGNGNPLQYFCLENPMDRGAWLATVHGSQSWTRLSNSTIYLSIQILKVSLKILCCHDDTWFHQNLTFLKT